MREEAIPSEIENGSEGVITVILPKKNWDNQFAYTRFLKLSQQKKVGVSEKVLFSYFIERSKKPKKIYTLESLFNTEKYSIFSQG